MASTVRDIVAHYYNTGSPVPGTGQTRVLQTREDIHEWLAEIGLDSNNESHMSMVIDDAQPLPPQADPSLTEVSGPPEAAHRRSQFAQPAPTLFAQQLPARTMSELSDVTTEGMGAAGAGVAHGAEPIMRTAEQLGADVSGIVERGRPEHGWHQGGAGEGWLGGPKQMPGRLSPTATVAVTPPRPRGSRPQPDLPGPSEAYQEENLEFMRRFIDEQPEYLPSGHRNEARRIAVEEYEKARPGIVSRAAKGAADAAMGILGPPMATMGGGLTSGAQVAPTPAHTAEAAYDVARVGMATAGNTAGLVTGAMGQAGALVAEALPAAGRAIQPVTDRLFHPFGHVFQDALELPRAAGDWSFDIGAKRGGETSTARELRHHRRDLERGDEEAIARDRRAREALNRRLTQSEEGQALPVEQKVGYVVANLRSAWDSMDEEVKKRLDRDLIDNMRTDLSDVMSVIPMLGALIFETPEDERDLSLGDAFTTAFTRNVKPGIGLTSSGFAGLAYIVANPLDSANTMPISTLLTFADVLAAAKPKTRLRAQLDRSPRLSAQFRKVKDAVDKYLPEVEFAIDSIKRGGAAARRALGDAAYNANPKAHAFGEVVLRDAAAEGRGARAVFEEMGRVLERDAEIGIEPAGKGPNLGSVRRFIDEDLMGPTSPRSYADDVVTPRAVERGPESTFKPTGKEFDLEFEEFEKAADPATGRIIQPERLLPRQVVETPLARVRKGEKVAIGVKGGARIRTRKVQRQTLAGEIRTIRDEFVESLATKSGSGRSPYRAKEIDRALSEAVSLEVPNMVMESADARLQIAKDLRDWATNPFKRDGETPRSRGSYFEKGSKQLDEFMKDAEVEILAMASRRPMKDRRKKDLAGSTSVYNTIFRIGDETFSALDDSILSLKRMPDISPLIKRIRAQTVTALANRAAETVQQRRSRLTLVESLDEYAPQYVTEPYTIRRGDTGELLVDHLKRTHGVTKGQVLKANKGLDLDNLKVGATIEVPVRYKAKRSRGGKWVFRGKAIRDVELKRIESALENDGNLPAALRIEPDILANALEKGLGPVHRPQGHFGTLLPLSDKVPGRLSGRTVGGVPIERVVRDLRQFKKIDEGTDMALELGVNKVREGGDVRKVEVPAVEVPGGVWVNPGTHSTLKWWARDITARRDNSGFHRAMRWMKANLTARNPTTHVHNIIANITIQGLRRGEVLTPQKVIQVASEYRDFTKGKLKDPEKVKMYRALERTGGIRTDMVTAELNALSSGVQKATHGYAPHKALEKVYGWEDNVFKLEEAARNYRTIEKYSDMLDDGGSMDLTLSKARTARVTKRGDKWEIQSGGRDGKYGKSYSLSETKRRDIMANAAMKPALDLFFDYTDVSQLAIMLRSTPWLMGGIAMPFYSWYSKALTLPFIQKGVVGSMFSSQPVVRTANARILTSQVKDAMATSARRSLVVNSMRDEMVENRDIISQLSVYGGRKRVPSLLKPVLGAFNPLYYEFRNLEYMSPSQPADTLLRAIYHGLGTVHVPTLVDAVMHSDVDLKDGLFTLGGAAEEYMSPDAIPPNDHDIDAMEKFNPREARRMRVLRNIWRRNPDIGTGTNWGAVTQDVVEMMGMGGGLLSTVPEALATGDYDEMKNTAASVFFPGVYTRGMDVAKGLAWRYGILTSDNWGGDVPGLGNPYRDSKEVAPRMAQHEPYAKRKDDFQRWWVRRLLGFGTSPLQISNEWRYGADGDKIHKRGALAKAYKRRIQLIKDSATEREESKATDAWERHTNPMLTDKERQEALVMFERNVAEIERVRGTQSANNFYQKYARGKWHPVGGKPIEGLVHDEGMNAYDWIVEPMLRDVSTRREAAGVNQMASDLEWEE